VPEVMHAGGKPTPGRTGAAGSQSPHDLLRILQDADGLDSGLRRTWSAALTYWRGDPAPKTVALLLALRHSPSVAAAEGVGQHLDADIAAGLERRLGQHIEPLAALDPIPAGDAFEGVLTGIATAETRAEILAFRLIRDLHTWAWRLSAGEVLGDRLRPAHGEAPLPATPSICEGCGVIFKPARKRRAKRCEACGKRRLPAATYFLASPHELSAWRPGSSIPLRVAELAGGQLVALRTRRVARCAECRRFFAPTKHADTCSDACWQRHRRREAA
jgi:hypothetical protein